MSEASFLQRVTARRGVRQFVKFAIVGASGTLVNLIIFTLLQHHGPYALVYSIAFLAGGVSNFFLNRAWTFRSTGHAGKEGAQFMLVSVIALLVGLGVSQLLAPYLGHGHKLWFCATVAGVLVNYFVNKYWTFRSVA